MNEIQNNLMDIVNRENQVLLATIDSNAEYYKLSNDVVDYLWHYVSGFDAENGLTFTLFLGGIWGTGIGEYGGRVLIY